MGDDFRRLFGEGTDAASIRSATSNLTENVLEGASRNGVKLSASTAQCIGQSALKVIGTVTDLAGIADLVTNSLGIAGGAFGTAAGVIGTAELFAGAAMPAVISAAAGPLFIAGAVLAGVGLVAGLTIQTVQQHNGVQDFSNSQGDWFKSLAKDGLLENDWGDKLEYARYAFTLYGKDRDVRDDYPTNLSIWDAQPAEWQYFRNTAPSGGSSDNRLNEDKHRFGWSRPLPNYDYWLMMA